jgi:hypothetical protein
MFNLIRKMFNKARQVGEYVGTFRTQDAAFTFRMLTGFAGTVNRLHPASIEPCLIDPTATIAAYGLAVVVNPANNGVRTIVAGDAALTSVYGVGARPFPVQQQSTTNYGATTLGGASVPPTSQPLDVLKSGYILVNIQNFAVANAAKGGTVDVWYAASAGQHIQGGFEAAHTGGSSLSLAQGQTYFNGPAGPDGVAELAFNL